MSITILPYIADVPKASATAKNNAISNTSEASKAASTATTSDFQTALDLAMKATAAISIDKLVKASANGSVNTEIVQKFFDDNKIPITLPKSGTLTTGTNTDSTTVDSDKATTATVSSLSSDKQIASSTAVSAADLDTYFWEASQTYGVSVKLLKSIAYCESNFDPNAVSHAGAVGIMQLMPATAKELGVTDSYDPRQNILGGAKLISQLLDKYDGDVSLALAAYNAGSGNVEKYGGIPPFKETQNYVKKVLAQYNS